MRASGIPFIQGRNGNGTSTKFGIAIHNTSNDGTADDEAGFATRRTDKVGSHFYADAVKVIQSNDTDRIVGHAGSANGNRNAIAVEITGFNGWSRQQWLTHVDWAELGAVLAQVCRAHGIPVERRTVSQMAENAKVRGFYGHDDMRRAWGGTTHTDPGPNFPWDHLLAAVSDALGGVQAPPTFTGGDMDFNQDAKLNALFNADTAVSLDTDGTVDGKGARAAFQVPLVALIRQNHKDLTDAIAALSGAPVGGEVLEGGPLELSDADVDRIADRLAAKLGARLAS